jgi:hypothetical protein
MNKTKMSFLVFLSLLLSSCNAIAGIFKAGMWVGIIGVVILVALILWLIGKAKK